jgi:hypothetical protein
MVRVLSSMPKRVRSASLTFANKRVSVVAAVFSRAGWICSMATWSRTSTTPSAWFTVNRWLAAYSIALSCCMTRIRW